MLITITKHYNLWQRLIGKPEEDRQKENLERLRQKLIEIAERDNITTEGLTMSEIQEVLDLLPKHI